MGDGAGVEVSAGAVTVAGLGAGADPGLGAGLGAVAGAGLGAGTGAGLGAGLCAANVENRTSRRSNDRSPFLEKFPPNEIP